MEDEYEEDQMLIDLLMKKLDLPSNINKKDIKILKKAINIIEEIKNENDAFTPTLQQLQQIKLEYEACVNEYNENIKYKILKGEMHE